jgi:carbon storage regulator
MLVLTRRIGEKLNIGDDIEVVIAGIKGNQVKVCITAPRDIEVHRHEVYLRMKAEKEGKIKAN